ncbi:MAG: 30S ribosomal protein S25e [Thermoprotei archaeon]|nr:MAG: 30S ribosomal protein S25e [Thermoprotei archaeon]
MAKRKTPEKETGAQTGDTALVTKIDVTDDLLRRLERDIRRNVFKVLTPYTLAQAYNIRISTARKALRIAAQKGLLTLYSGGRTPVYIKAQPESTQKKK